jgi:hypothetical protein
MSLQWDVEYKTHKPTPKHSLTNSLFLCLCRPVCLSVSLNTLPWHILDDPNLDSAVGARRRKPVRGLITQLINDKKDLIMSACRTIR